jgi:hypothetical protein
MKNKPLFWLINITYWVAYNALIVFTSPVYKAYDSLKTICIGITFTIFWILLFTSIYDWIYTKFEFREKTLRFTIIQTLISVLVIMALDLSVRYGGLNMLLWRYLIGVEPEALSNLMLDNTQNPFANVFKMQNTNADIRIFLVWMFVQLNLVKTFAVLIWAFAYNFYNYNSKVQENKISQLQLENQLKEAELQSLRTQVDPHFLFNSLNTLSILIDINPAESRLFTERLANLYRELVKLKDTDLVALSEELKFIEDYIYLLQKRFGTAYLFEIKKNGVDTEGVFLPPSALQLLVENAVKHNAGNPENPIVVEISVDNQSVTVKNNKRLKVVNDSTGMGLKNLHLRYELLTDKQIKIENTEGVFSITLPLVKMIS